MIEIKYNAEALEVEIKGHAGYADMGKDIVCSAVSCLFYTLAETLEKSSDYLKGYTVNTEKGYIKAVPKPQYKAVIQRTFFTICTGLSMIAEEYPKNVAFSKVVG